LELLRRELDNMHDVLEAIDIGRIVRHIREEGGERSPKERRGRRGCETPRGTEHMSTPEQKPHKPLGSPEP